MPFNEFFEFGSTAEGSAVDVEIANLPPTRPGQPTLYFPKSKQFPVGT